MPDQFQPTRARVIITYRRKAGWRADRRGCIVTGGVGGPGEPPAPVAAAEHTHSEDDPLGEEHHHHGHTHPDSDDQA